MRALSIRGRVAVAAGPALLLLVVLLVIQLTSSWMTVRQSESLLSLIEFAPTFSAAVDNLQRERGYSAGFVSSGGENFRASLAGQRGDTDRAITILREVAPQLPGDAAAAPLVIAVQEALGRLDDLGQMRTRVDGTSITVPEMAAYYTGTINLLIGAIEAIVPLANEGQAQGDLVAYLAIIKGKERAGLERAMGATGFSSGAFSPQVYRNFIRLIAQQEAYLDSARATAPEAVIVALNAAESSPEAAQIERLRAIVLANADNGAGLGDVTGPEWFRASSDRIEGLFAVEGVANTILVEDTRALVRQARTTMFVQIGVEFILLAIFAAIALMAARSITNPILAITRQMGVLASGDTDFDVVGQDQGHEIGQIAEAMEVFRQNRMAANALEAQLTEERAAQSASQQEQESQISEQVGAIVAAASAGDLSARVDVDRLSGVLRQIGEGLNGLLDTLSAVFGSLEQSMEALAEGDLTHRAQGDWAGRFQSMNDTMDGTAQTLAALLSSVRQISGDVNVSATEVAQASDDLADRTSRQAANLQEVAAAMEEIVATVSSTAEAAGSAKADSESALTRAREGGDIVQQASEAMRRMVGTSAQITTITAMIEDIAFQTNLLALNASVEAARAGENGRGFAVVAQEVRSLAQRSSDSSRNIKQLIQAITGDVQAGAGLVDQVRQALEQIVREVEGTAQQTANIALAAVEQRNALGELNTSVTTMDEFTQRNATAVGQTANAAETMRQRASELSDSVQAFRL